MNQYIYGAITNMGMKIIIMQKPKKNTFEIFQNNLQIQIQCMLINKFRLLSYK